MKPNDPVRILTEHMPDVLIQTLGRGRNAIYTGMVIAVNGDRVQVLLDGSDDRALWFDADVLTTNLTPQLEMFA